MKAAAPRSEPVEAGPGHRVRCYVCFRPAPLCLCGRVSRVRNRTRITILQHPRERFHAMGTARLARLGLDRVEVIVPRKLGERPLELAPIERRGVGLLYPRAGARDLASLLPAERPVELVVLDGTWAHAGRLYKSNPWLADLPHFALSPSAPSNYRIRKQPRAGYVSTIEAIVMALGILEPENDEPRRLLDDFDQMIDEQIVHAHRAPRRMEKKYARKAARGEKQGDSDAR